ncbi:hypothetical protein [Streptomyces sp. CRN 30]|uniref:hypothetical protein n=1 Tax=Streptomyces sp. CRN 30 TaxID=3075613 RepID=UPI002A8283F1|nr:hypothetical protein [Streptomyces sp. CRN 30]
MRRPKPQSKAHLPQVELNRQRNIRRILDPPRPTPTDHFWRLRSTIEEWWCRHFTQRDLYRLLDRSLLRLDVDDPETYPDRTER